MGQFRASQCPLCGSTENGKWTCSPCTLIVGVHRELVRSLQSWHGWYENQEVGDTLLARDGREYCLWDVDLFYAGRTMVADRQRQAIELCLYENRLEKVAAVEMGISENSPVSIYATIGLTSMIGAASTGRMPGYYLDLDLEINRAEVLLSEHPEVAEQASVTEISAVQQTATLDAPRRLTA